MITRMAEIKVGDRISFLDWSYKMPKVKKVIWVVKKMELKSTGDNPWRFPMLRDSQITKQDDLYYAMELIDEASFESFTHGFTPDWLVYKNKDIPIEHKQVQDICPYCHGEGFKSFRDMVNPKEICLSCNGTGKKSLLLKALNTKKH